MELTMTKPSITIAAVAAMACIPTLGLAANSPIALDSCVKAFMTSLSTTKPGAFKLREAHYTADADAGYLDQLSPSIHSELMLTAHDAHDNHEVARAVCTVNSQGEVISLRPQPLSGMEPY
jgi:hypothetical protein